MIKKWPGWANWIALSLIYLITGLTFKFILSRYTVDWQYIVVIAGIHSGIYLAKWSYDKGHWRYK